MSILALDIGSSRIKVLSASWDGRLLDVDAAATPRLASDDGEMAYPADAVQATIEALISTACARQDQVADTLVFSCLGTAMVPSDAAGRPLGPALAPADTRPSDGPGLDSSVELTAAELRHMTGSDPEVASFLLHFLWWQRTRPELMRHVLLVTSDGMVVVAGSPPFEAMAHWHNVEFAAQIACLALDKAAVHGTEPQP